MKRSSIMPVDANIVKQLRDKTGAGMMDCKNALTESNGDLDAAIDVLRKSGVAKAEKKGSRETKEGLVYSYIHAGGRLGVMIEVNCETDFVAKTTGFIELAHNLAQMMLLLKKKKYIMSKLNHLENQKISLKRWLRVGYQNFFKKTV